MLGSFSSAVRGVRLVTAAGDVIECSPTRDAEVFHAACTAMGTLGVVTQLRMQNRERLRAPRARLHGAARRGHARDLERLITGHRHFEFWAFYRRRRGHGEDARRGPGRRRADGAAGDSSPDRRVLRTASELAHRIPALAGSLQRLLASLAPGRHTRRPLVPRVSEPAERPLQRDGIRAADRERPRRACSEILATVAARGVTTPLPDRVPDGRRRRLLAQPLLPRASAPSISIHQYAKVDYRELFATVEPIFRKHEGRPHWGKLHTLGAAELAELYPQWDAFQAVRRRLDPGGSS